MQNAHLEPDQASMMELFCENSLELSAIYRLKKILDHRSLVLTYNFTDNFGPPIPASDWLIFCCENLILHQKKK